MQPGFDYYKQLFDQLLQGKLSPQEAEMLIKWLSSAQADTATAELIQARLQEPAGNEMITPGISAALDANLSQVLSRLEEKPPVRRSLLHLPWLRYAAAVLVLLGTGAYFLYTGKQAKQPAAKQVAQAVDVAPGRNGAVLTLDNGSTVVLDSLGNGVVATQNGTKVLLKNGRLLYNTAGPVKGTVTYNTMTTPKGRQFQLVLPDGSKVWLNAASSLRYPTVFAGSERTVEVTGEAYFEVAKNATMPFVVKVGNETEVQVLGTHFNINSYQDEANINTTLLEGSVRVLNKGKKALLKPGQSAQVAMQTNQATGIKIVNDVDMEKIMAWKNGLFNFQDASLKEVMHQLERWYDIEVVYEKGAPEIEFVGKMERSLSLSEVLRGLQISEVHFRIEQGRRLVVMP